MGGMIGTWRSFNKDASVLKEKIKPGTTRRTLRYAAPYAGWLAVFLLVVVVDATVTIVYPLLFRRIINDGILKGNEGLILHLAVAVALLGIFDGFLGLMQTFLASSIGAGIVLSLRARLFTHIQQMPLAFFTRAQTGALVSRLNNDVGGARTAFHRHSVERSRQPHHGAAHPGRDVRRSPGGSRSRRWCCCRCLSSRARFWGRKLQEIARESYDLTAAMNSLMVERFNVAGALLAKLFGRPAWMRARCSRKRRSGSPTSASRQRSTAASSSPR